MAIGLVPIVFDYIANHYWIQPGQNGLFFTSLSPDHIAQRIKEAADNLVLREQARILNPRIVREQGDLQHNSCLYLEQFYQVAKSLNRKALTRDN
jgi:hypothetical protein